MRLRRRYRTFFTVDQIVWVLYAATALVPAWGLLTYPQGKPFSAIGMILIASVACLGYSGNSMLKRNNPKGKAVGLAASALLFVSRVGILWYAIIMAKRSFSMEWSDIDWFGDLGILTAWAVFIVGFYRLAYHISAHCYVRLFIENVEQNGSTERGDGASVSGRSPQAPGR